MCHILPFHDNGDDLGPWCCPNDNVYVKTYTIVLVGNLFTPSPDTYIYGGKKSIIEVMLSEVCGYLCSLKVKSGLPPGRNSTWRCWWSMCYAKKNKNVAFCEDVSENTYTPSTMSQDPSSTESLPTWSAFSLGWLPFDSVADDNWCPVVSSGWF